MFNLLLLGMIFVQYYMYFIKYQRYYFSPFLRDFIADNTPGLQS